MPSVKIIHETIKCYRSAEFSLNFNILAVSDPYVQKQNSRRNIPPHVPPRNDVAPVVIPPSIPNVAEHPRMNNEHIKEQKENIKPASDPWKATPEQKKFYSDEFEKLPKVQGMGLYDGPYVFSVHFRFSAAKVG